MYSFALPTIQSCCWLHYEFQENVLVYKTLRLKIDAFSKLTSFLLSLFKTYFLRVMD